MAKRTSDSYSGPDAPGGCGLCALFLALGGLGAMGGGIFAIVSYFV